MLEALAFYVENFGVRQGFEMYKYLGVENLPNGEYLYIKGNDLLRVTLDGDFVSLYPGADTALVNKALEGGELLWEK